MDENNAEGARPHQSGQVALAAAISIAGNWWADIAVGAALGPVFTTCSPTFFVILATVLPQSLAKGLIDLAAYIIGLALSLFLISWLGQKLVGKLEWAANPYGWFRKILGILFVLLASPSHSVLIKKRRRIFSTADSSM